MSANQDLRVSEPDLKDALQQLKREIMLELQSAHIGVIEDFDPLTQTATVRIAYKRTFFVKNNKGGLSPELYDYPLLADVPVYFPGGGAGNLTFPVAEGDECLLVINGRDIDRWHVTGDNEAGCQSMRLHALTDAIAFVGVRSIPNSLLNFQMDRAALNNGATKNVYAADDSSGLEHGNFKVIADDTYARLENGDTVVGTGGGKVKFENANTSLKTELQALIDHLKDLNTALGTLIDATAAITVPYVSPGGPAVSSPPVNAAAITAVKTNIQNVTTAIDGVKTNLGDLLV